MNAEKIHVAILPQGTATTSSVVTGPTDEERCMSKATPTLQPVLERLSTFEPTGLPVLSLYLDTGPDQHGRDNYDAFLRKELKVRGQSFPASSPQRDSYEKDAERITAFLNTELQPSANGVALFACAGANDFFEAVQLDARIEEHRLYVADRPHLYPLARLSDQHPPYAVLIADTNSARLLVIGRGTTLRTETVQGEKTRRSSMGGWSQMRYQRHTENIHLRNAKEIVSALERVVSEDRVEQIVLAGDEVIVPLLREQLPASLAERVIDVLRLDITTPEHDVLETTMATLREHDARTDAEAVEEMLGQYRSGQLGTVGARGTLAALERGQVDTLLISATPDAVRNNAPAEGPADPSVAVPGGEDAPIAERLVRMAQQTSAAVRFIEDPALLADVGGVGATLRFRI
jgi:peptide subunit release factor 1 (eRF1)